MKADEYTPVERLERLLDDDLPLRVRRVHLGPSKPPRVIALRVEAGVRQRVKIDWAVSSGGATELDRGIVQSRE